MVLRLWEYTLRIIDDHIKQGHTHFPLVCQMVYYNGKTTPYPFSTDFWEYFENSETAKSIMLRPFKLVDANQTSEDFPAHRISAFLEMLLKYAGQKRDFLKVLKRLAETGNLTMLCSRGTTQYLVDMVYFAARETEISNKDDFVQTIEEILPGIGEKTMSLLQQEFDAGIQKGMEKGMEHGIYKVAKNLLKKEKDEIFVAEMTGLSIEEIQKLKKSSD